MKDHTKGPWEASPFSSVVGIAITAQPDPKLNRVMVAKVFTEADARLVEASPDGYAAAKDMLESARGVFGDNVDTYPAQWREQLRALKAFVAKVEGKS